MSLQTRLGELITAVGADIKKMVTLADNQLITGTKTFPPGTLLMRNAGATATAEPYSDVNAPLTLNRTVQASTPASPASGTSVEWSVDGKSLDMKAADGTVTRIGPSSGGGGGGTKVSALTAATALGGTDSFVVVQGGTTKKIAASLVVPVPWVEVPLLLGTTAALTPVAASAAAGVELYTTTKATRNKLDLSWASEVRLVALVIANGNVAGVNWKLQYATADASTWASGTGVADAGVSLTLGAGTTGVLRDSGWVSLAAGAKIDSCYIAMVNGTTAQGTTAPTVGSMSAFFR